jgi:tetratricopeptide (TPR) repeat protein
MNEHPDSALAILDSLYRHEAEMDNHFRMQVLLYRTEAQNKLFTRFPSDSIQTGLVGYFDRHGTRNERMLAHYLLGCVLSDLGNSPEALQAFYDAIEMADTTRADCDLRTLRVVYGQMVMLFHQQNLPHDELRALQQYIRLTERLCSEEDVIIAKGQMKRPYFLLGMEDSIISLEYRQYNEMKRLGKEKEAGEVFSSSPYYYLMRGDTAKAKEMMDLYEQAVMDSSGNVAQGRESYYYFKGLYEHTVGHLDAAEYWYRRAESYHNLQYAYRDCCDSSIRSTMQILYSSMPGSMRMPLTRYITRCERMPFARCRPSTTTAAVSNRRSRRLQRHAQHGCGYGHLAFRPLCC